LREVVVVAALIDPFANGVSVLRRGVAGRLVGSPVRPHPDLQRVGVSHPAGAVRTNVVVVDDGVGERRGRADRRIRRTAANRDLDGLVDLLHVVVGNGEADVPLGLAGRKGDGARCVLDVIGAPTGCGAANAEGHVHVFSRRRVELEGADCPGHIFLVAVGARCKADLRHRVVVENRVFQVKDGLISGVEARTLGGDQFHPQRVVVLVEGVVVDCNIEGPVPRTAGVRVVVGTVHGLRSVDDDLSFAVTHFLVVAVGRDGEVIDVCSLHLEDGLG